MSFALSKRLFFFLLVFTPLAFGTTEPWSYAVMEILTAVAVLGYFVHVFRHDAGIYQVPGIVPLVIFLGYILFQVVPLPAPVVAILSPKAFEIHTVTRAVTDTTAFMTVSLHPGSTVSEFFRYTTYVLFYVLTVQLLCRKDLLRTTVFVVAVFGGLLAFSSILQFYLTTDMALWFRHAPNNSIVVGPYVNHNHYAGLMEMIFPVVLGLFLFYRPRIHNTSLIRGIAEIFSQEKANIHILIGASALLIVVSIFVSLSRGAMISTVVSLVVFTGFLLKRRISRGNTLLIMGMIILAALSIGWFGWEQILERFARLKNAHGIIHESRLDFWKDTWVMIQDFVFTGSGMGTFSHVYPLYRTIISDRFLTHAHNDYLELLSEGGVFGFFLAALFLLVVFYKTYAVFMQRRDAFSIYLYIGSLSALVAILVHSVTDFNLHIGANGLWFFFIAGMLVASAHTSQHKNSRETRLALVRSRKIEPVLVGALCCITLAVAVFNLSHLMGRFYYNTIKNYPVTQNTAAETYEKIDKIARLTARFDQFHGAARFTSADIAWFAGNEKRAEKLFVEALVRDPLNSLYLGRFATFLARRDQKQRAELGFQKSMLYDKTRPDYTFQYATWLLAGQNREKGLQYLRRTLELDETFIDRVLTTMIVAGIDRADIEQAIPDTPGPAIAFAGFLFDTGEVENAIARYLQCLDLIEAVPVSTVEDPQKQARRKRSWYYQIYRFFHKHNDFQNAIKVMERAEKELPMDAGIKVTLGDLYYGRGILYKALDKYNHALLLSPNHPKAARMAKKINQ
ncbi:MAG: O-antigen ligase family protein [Desulfotignum sp.]